MPARSYIINFFIVALIGVGGCRSSLKPQKKEGGLDKPALVVKVDISITKPVDEVLGGPLSDLPEASFAFTTSRDASWTLKSAEAPISLGKSIKDEVNTVTFVATDLPDSDGEHLLIIEAVDIDGHVASKEVKITLDKTPPSPPKDFKGTFTKPNAVELTWTKQPDWLVPDIAYIRSGEEPVADRDAGKAVASLALTAEKINLEKSLTTPINYYLFPCDEIRNCHTLETCPECEATVEPQLEICEAHPDAQLYSDIGAGTAEDPYRLCHGDQLASLKNIPGEVSQHFALEGNIDLQEFYDAGGQEFSFTQGSNCSTSTSSNFFSGVFDGKNFSISNYTRSDTAASHLGMFGCILRGEVKNLTLIDPVVNGKDMVGAISGQSEFARITNVHIQGGTITGANYVGGVFGYSDRGSTLTSVSNSATIQTTTNYSGGIVGSMTGAIKSASNSGAVSGTAYVGGVIGVMNWGSVDRSANSGAISGNTQVGGIAGLSHGIISNNLTTAEATISGNGSKIGGLIGYSGHFTINSASHAAVTNNGVGATSTGGLVGHTTMNSAVQNSYATGSVTSLGDNTGGLVGDGSAINSYATGNVTSTGTVTGGAIGFLNRDASNLLATGNVEGVGLTAEVGQIVGKIQPTYSLNNSHYHSGATCFSDGATQSTGCNNTAAGFNATLSDFYNKANAPLSSWDFADDAGDGKDDFWEQQAAALPRIWHEGTTTSPIIWDGSGTPAAPYLVVSGTDFEAIGANPRWIDKSFKLVNSIDVSAASRFPGEPSGPFAGTFDGNNRLVSGLNRNISDFSTGLFSYTTANSHILNISISAPSITGLTGAGGLVGSNFGTISNSNVAGGTITATGERAGGLAGINYGQIYDSSSTAAVSAVNYAGGLIGFHGVGELRRSFATGTVSTSGMNAGGLVGINWYGAMSDCYATGDVTGGAHFTGGLSGFSQGQYIERCYASGNVIGAGAKAGGLVGGTNAGSKVIDSFAVGEVRNDHAETGRLIGNMADTSAAENSFSLSAAFCDSATTASPGTEDTCTTYGSTHPSLADFHGKDKDPMAQWDFEAIWQVIAADLPVLR